MFFWLFLYPTCEFNDTSNKRTFSLPLYFFKKFPESRQLSRKFYHKINLLVEIRCVVRHLVTKRCCHFLNSVHTEVEPLHLEVSSKCLSPSQTFVSPKSLTLIWDIVNNKDVKSTYWVSRNDKMENKITGL